MDSGGEDPEWAYQRQFDRAQLGLPAIDDQTWPIISRITATGDSASHYLIREALRVGLEKVAPGVSLVKDWIVEDNPGDAPS